MIAALLLAIAVAGSDRSGLQERVADIRVHGNATISDEAVIALAGVAVGATLDEAGLEAIEKKLRDSGRFDEVEVRKRYRTLAMDEVALLLIVHEKPGVSPTGKPPSAMKRLASSLMFMPILDYEDGYGVTYGARTTIVDLLGKGTHLSVPVSGGGTRKVAVEASHTFKSGPLTRLSGAYGLVERENPHYEIDDRRTSLSGRAERRLFDKLTLGAEAARSNVTFEPSRDRFWSGGADVTLDTRNDPGFPSDAVLATAAWSRLNAMGDTRALWSTPEIDRYKLEARGYKRIFRQTVAAGRVRYDTASAPLPLYEQFLLGGSLLRGLDAGEFAGDARLLWGAEVRAPFTSPLGGGRLGLKAFIDGGTVAPHGARLEDQKMYRGAGGGFFIDSRVFQLHFDVAHSLDGKGTHFHFGTSFTF